MAGWPDIDQNEDRWLARSLGSDEAAAARLYDLYAARLFDYCHVLLRDEEVTARAVLDALLAAGRRGGDPRAFRGRLYGVTREACMRLKSGAPAERRRAAEAADGTTDDTTRRLVHSALLVLSGRQREVLDLSMRHGLRADDLAEVLRISPDDVAATLVRARSELEDAFVALWLMNFGHRDCPSLASFAGSANQPLDARTCKVLVRHAAGCPICGAHTHLEISTARLLDAMPVAAVPENLRARFLAAASGSPATAVTEPAAGPAAGPVGERGARRASRERSRTGSRLWPVAAGVAFATAMTGGTFYALSGSGSQDAGNDQAMPSDPGGLLSDGPSASSVPLSGRGSASPSPTPSQTSGTPTPTPTPGHDKAGHARPGMPSPVVSSPPTQGPPPPPPPGTLMVSGCSMGSHHSCTITVTASGGPVSWSVTGTSGVSAAGGGYLNAGESAGVAATRGGGWCWGHHSGSVSFSSGASVSVDWYC